MHHSYRFVRFDGASTSVLTLICASETDALTIAQSLGGEVEVWDGARRVGMAGEPAPPLESTGEHDLRRARA